MAKFTIADHRNIFVGYQFSDEIGYRCRESFD